MADGSRLSVWLRAALRPVIALALFVLALDVLSHELAATSWRAVIGSAKATPWRQIAAALGLTVLNYAVLTGYDFLAFASIREAAGAMAYRRWPRFLPMPWPTTLDSR
jgi:uncharacterized membrane protein YbhN (UPF0104 family)